MQADLRQQNIHPRVVQECLGHADISLTLNTYSRVLPSMQDEVAGKLDELMSLIDIESELRGVELPVEPKKGHQ